jgi:hypothetical protein
LLTINAWQYQSQEYSFGEENDVWVKRVIANVKVSSQVLFKNMGIEVLVPKP